MASKGFTLIELLVVITIIGILASVVLVSFPGAVSRAKDSRVSSSMSQLRTQAVVLYANQGSYIGFNCSITDGVCNCSDTTVQYLCNDVEKNSDLDMVIYLNSDAQGFCAVSHLPGSEKYFCIDGNLHGREYSDFPSACNLACESQPASSNPCRCE